MRYICYLGTMLLLSNTFAANPPKVIVATGKEDSTYNRMFKELGAACYSHAQWLEYKTAGSTRNYELLLKDIDYTNPKRSRTSKVPKKYERTDLAFIQHDLLNLSSVIDIDDRDLKKHIDKSIPSYSKGVEKNLKTFLTLHTEEVHLISKKDKRGSLKKSKRIAAWGGSYITAAIIKQKLGLDYKIMLHNNPEEALKSLKDDKVDLILAVDGQPVKWIEELDNHTLIPIHYDTKLENIYEKSILDSKIYKNLIYNDIPTIKVRNAIVMRTPVKAHLKKILNNYKNCARRVIPILAKPNEKWKDVPPIPEEE